MSKLNDRSLRRFWFAVPGSIGIGVTAYTRQEAETLANAAARDMGQVFESISVIEDVDIRELDQMHVIPNIGPPNLQGVWFPFLNLRQS